MKNRSTAFAAVAGLIFNAVLPTVTVARGTSLEKNQEMAEANLFAERAAQNPASSYSCDTKPGKGKPAVSVNFIYEQTLHGNIFSGSVVASYYNPRKSVGRVIAYFGQPSSTTVIGDVSPQQIQQADNSADKWFLACFKAAHEGAAKIRSDDGQSVPQPKAKNVDDVLWGHPEADPVITHKRYTLPVAPGCVIKKGPKTFCLL